MVVAMVNPRARSRQAASRRNRWAAAVGCLAVTWACVHAPPTGAAEAEKPGRLEDPFELVVEPLKKEYLWGEPVFVKLTLVNRADVPLQLADITHKLPQVSEVETARADGALQEVFILPDAGWMVYYPRPRLPGATLAPGGSLGDCAELWLTGDGDVPGERSLVFSPPGEWRLRITLRLTFRTGEAEEWQHTVAAEGARFYVLPEGTPGLVPFVKTMREIVTGRRGHDLYVQYADMARLVALAEELGDSPYTKYVKWIYLRSFNINKPEFYEEPDAAVRKETRERARDWSDELREQCGPDCAPILRDALVTAFQLAPSTGHEERIAARVEGRPVRLTPEGQAIRDEFERRVTAEVGLSSDWLRDYR